MAVELEYYGVPPADYREVESRFRYVASASQTTFTAAYSVGFVDVFLNGSKLDPVIEFTGTDGINIILAVAAAAGDIVEIISRRQLTPTDIYSRSQVDLLLSNYYGITTNTGDAFVVTTTPSFTTMTNGMEIKLRMNVANTTTTPTLNPNGLGAKQILTYNQQPCTIGDWGANSEITLRYNQALDKFIIVEGMLTAITPTQFDSSSKIATTSFLKNAGASFPGLYTLIPSSTTLTASQAGGWFLINTASVTVTLPALASVPAGATFTFKFTGAGGGGVVKGSGSESIFAGGTSGNTYAVIANETLMFVASNGQWDLLFTGFSNRQFSTLLASPGWTKLPSGLLIQWGVVSTSSGGATVTFPVTFSNGVLSVVATANASAQAATVSTGALSLGSFPVYSYTNGSPVGMSVDWMAIGF